MKKLNVCGGVPTPDAVERDTIRMTVQIDVPYDNDTMNNGYISKQKIVDFINSDAFSSYGLIAGPRKGL